MKSGILDGSVTPFVLGTSDIVGKLWVEKCYEKSTDQITGTLLKRVFTNIFLSSVIRNIRVGQGRISKFLKIERKTRQKGDANQ